MARVARVYKTPIERVETLTKMIGVAKMKMDFNFVQSYA